MSIPAPAQEFREEYKAQIHEVTKAVRELWEQRQNPETAVTSIDQRFVCGVLNVEDDAPYPASDYIVFRADGSLRSSFDSLPNNVIGATRGGYYSYSPLLGGGLSDYYIRVGGRGEWGQAEPLNDTFDMGNVRQTNWRNMIRYFNASGQHTIWQYVEDGFGGHTNTPVSTNLIEMYCHATEHGYNNQSSERVFQCPRHETPAGGEDNVIALNWLGPGNARRERHIYIDGSDTPAETQSSNVGMYFQGGNKIVMDFNVNPILRLEDFSDHNELNAHLVQNGDQWQLVVDEFPPGGDICEEVLP